MRRRFTHVHTHQLEDGTWQVRMLDENGAPGICHQAGGSYDLAVMYAALITHGVTDLEEVKRDPLWLHELFEHVLRDPHLYQIVFDAPTPPQASN